MVNPKLMDTANRLGAGITPTAHEPQTPMPSQTTLDERIVLLDPMPEEKKRFQDGAVAYWNTITDGRTMASMPDYYQAFKQFRQISKSGTVPEKQEVLLKIDKIRYCAKRKKDNQEEDWIISSTRIEYDINSINARIVHHYNCQNADLIIKHGVAIPAYDNATLIQVIEDKTGLKFLQALFNTKDSKETITQTLEYIGDKVRTNIQLLTPLQEEREEHPYMAAGFYTLNEVFCINGLCMNIKKGFSFGMSYKNPS